MADHIVLVEQAGDWKPGFPEVPVVQARDYLTGGDFSGRKGLRVVNLCRSYRYLSTGYYCSLLAEARGHKVVPAARTIQDLSRRSIYTLVTEDLDDQVHRTLERLAAASMPPTGAYEVTICFGQCDIPELREIARQVFEAFRCPVLAVEFRRQQTWQIHSVRPLPIARLDARGEAAFVAAFEAYLGRRWRAPRSRPTYRYDMAILHDPKEELPPSDERALRRFLAAGRELGMDVELITRQDYGRLAEYDALFIRETTRLDHHTYRFARRADAEGLVVIDDPDSILRCTNKVYLAELLAAHRVPTPRTVVLRREGLRDLDARIPYPIVLKIPDGSFSRGVFKAENRAELEEYGQRLLKESDLILAQEYLYTPFDWRVGILAGEPLYVCRYFMSGGHWQIYDHAKEGIEKEGDSETLAVADAPPEVVRTALDAAALVGDGLYGVDMKQTDKGVVVIEVNDNPSVDSGYEDAVLGPDLYRRVMGEFLARLERRTRESAPGERRRAPESRSSA